MGRLTGASGLAMVALGSTVTITEIASAASENPSMPRHDEPLQEWFLRLRSEWFRRLRPLGSWVPWELRDHVELVETDTEPAFWGEGLIRTAPELQLDHLRHCVLLPNRIALIGRLPKHGVVAEVGTLHGEFSRE